MQPTAVLEPGSRTNNNAAAEGGRGGINAEWQEAAGQIALVTPLMVVGTDSYIETDMVERLKVRAELLTILFDVYNTMLLYTFLARLQDCVGDI